MMKLAMRAVQLLGWKLEQVNENLGLVTFETGVSWGSWSGISCSLNIEEVGPNTFRVKGTGKQNVRGAQIFAVNVGGEAQGRAQKAIDKMKEIARVVVFFASDDAAYVTGQTISVDGGQWMLG